MSVSNITPRGKPLALLSIDELYGLLSAVEGSSLHRVAKVLKEQEVDGDVLSNLQELDSLIEELGVTTIGPKRALKQWVQSYSITPALAGSPTVNKAATPEKVNHRVDEEDEESEDMGLDLFS